MWNVKGKIEFLKSWVLPFFRPFNLFQNLFQHWKLQPKKINPFKILVWKIDPLKFSDFTCHFRKFSYVIFRSEKFSVKSWKRAPTQYSLVMTYIKSWAFLSINNVFGKWKPMYIMVIFISYSKPFSNKTVSIYSNIYMTQLRLATRHYINLICC